MFEANGKRYELKYNIKRIEMIENAMGMPSMPELYKNRGMLSILSLKAYIAYALKEEDGDTFVKPKEGMEMADKLIEESGYLAVNEVVVKAIQRDCPFLFPAD
mgnify:FL=1